VVQLWLEISYVISDTLCGEGSVVARDLLCAITLVVNLWLGGRSPLSLAEFVASTPLTPLLKPNGGDFFPKS